MNTIGSATASESHRGDDGYEAFERLVRERVAAAKGAPLFTTDADPDSLWRTYLDGLPGDRQHYNCRACRQFIQAYGSLVRVDESGDQDPVLWAGWYNDTPSFFADSVSAMCRLVLQTRVTGVFYSDATYWGKRETPDVKRGVVWSHLSAENPNPYRRPTLSAAQAMAEKREEYGMLRRGLAEYPKTAVEEAVRVLEADALDRSEKTLGVAKWLLDLHRRTEALHGSRKDNLVWLAVATAPPGWCHVKTTMIGTLLDDVVAGLPYEQVKRRWAEKMHPLQYQRPQAPPKDGTIKQAEELVKKLGVERSLARRYARVEDVLAWVWRPCDIPQCERTPNEGGVFDHLRRAKQEVRKLQLPAKTLTWKRFAGEVLVRAHRLELLTPSVGSYYGMLTAADPESPAILQWDGIEGERRNPCSGYVYVHGSPAIQWGLGPATWAGVNGVCEAPHRWQRPERFTHQGEGVLLVLEGARDSRTECGNALFPEILKSEYHGIRGVIEAHAKTCSIGGREEASANGYWLGAKGDLNVRLRVDGSDEYLVDRWE